MSRLKMFSAIIVVGLLTLFGFQNCGKSNSNSAGGTSSAESTELYLNMNSSEAQTMMSAYEGLCASHQTMSSAYPLLSSGASINLAGNQVARGSFISSVQGVGNLEVYGVTSGSKINSVSNFNGNIQLCGIDLVSISGATSANIVINGGTVGSISDFSGNLFLFENDFPTNISSFDGNIVIKNSSGQYFGRTYHIP